MFDIAHCPTDQAAWYYDNPSAPTQILLCPSACALVSDLENGARVTATIACEEYVPSY